MKAHGKQLPASLHNGCGYVRARGNRCEHPGNGRHTPVIMAKAPRPGMVKTRLARSLPVSTVTALYRCLLDDTISLA